MLALLMPTSRVAGAEGDEAAEWPAASSQASPSSVPKAEKVFDVLEYRVEGNTLIETVDIERAVYPYLGQDKTIDAINGARQALEKVYHDHGYLTVQVFIPEQRVADGVVTLKVTEAEVGKLRIVGSRYHSLNAIRAAVPDLKEGSVPNFGDVQKELATLNRSSDRRVTPVLHASDTPGKVDVDLQVKDELPQHASLELNNYYSANTSHLRAIADVHYDNLFQREQSIDFQYQASPDNISDVRVWSLSYVIPTRSDGVWALYAVHSDSNVSAVSDLDVIGRGDIYGLRLIEPLSGSDSGFYHSFTAGIDYKDFKQNLILQGADQLPTPIHYAPFTLQYGATWLQPAISGKDSGGGIKAWGGSTGVTAAINFAIRGFASDAQQFHDKRSDASASYLIFKPSIQRQQGLPRRWSLVGSLDGQLASGPLISNEEYSIGGISSVRGYTESERQGDDGLRGSIELRTPNLLSSGNGRIERSYVFAFAERAVTRVREPLDTQQSYFALSSCGLGARFKGYGLVIDLDAAHVLNEGYVTSSGSNRIMFRLNYGF
jgi:hemolysin activation/secretion protein